MQNEGDSPKPEIHNPAKFGIFHNESGMIGFRTFFSTNVKMHKRPIEPISKTMINAWFQPYTPPLDNTNDNKINPPVDIAAPRKSSLGFSCPSSLSLGKIMKLKIPRLPVITTVIRKMYRQPRDEVRKPPRMRPEPNPTAPEAAKMERAVVRSFATK